ncbi:hypothetical protein [Streptomyces sp. NPDC059076]|uniref:hypothetical protein n=1 Tax=unclassified Streptomyces TaxID=2593676 RepID=UPI0036BB50B4
MATRAKNPATEPTTEQAAPAVQQLSARERLNNRKRAVATMTICDDHGAKSTLAEAQMQLKQAERLRDRSADPADMQPVVEKAEAALTAAQAAYDQAAIVLRFEALERTLFEDIKQRHPATEEQAEDGTLYNIETLGPELIAASSLDGITEDEARHYFQTWSDGEATTLFNTAWDIQGERRMDVGKG